MTFCETNLQFSSLQSVYQVARKTPSLLGRGYKRLVAKRQTNVEFVAVRHIV